MPGLPAGNHNTTLCQLTAGRLSFTGVLRDQAAAAFVPLPNGFIEAGFGTCEAGRWNIGCLVRKVGCYLVEPNFLRFVVLITAVDTVDNSTLPGIPAF